MSSHRGGVWSDCFPRMEQAWERVADFLPTPPGSPKGAFSLPAAAETADTTGTAAGCVDLESTWPPVVDLEDQVPVKETHASKIKEGGFTEWNRSCPFWLSMKAFEGDLGLHCVETNHAGLNLCLCFSALISMCRITVAQQKST